MTSNDYMEMARNFFEYVLFNINQTPITPASVIVFVFIFVGFLVLAHLLANFLGKRVFSRFHIEEGIRYNFERIIRYSIGILGTIISFQFIGINLSSMAFMFGLLSVGIGFGLQNVTSNFVAGLILLFERPIKVGDRISVGESEGDVVAINLRSTTILSVNNIAIIVPNSEFISSNVVNWSYSDKKVRLNIDVGVSYNSDLDTVLQCIKDVALDNPAVLDHPDPLVHLVSFGDSSWNMTLRCWIADPKEHRQVTSDINCAIVRIFREHHVEIPFPQRDLHIRSAIPLPISKS